MMILSQKEERGRLVHLVIHTDLSLQPVLHVDSMIILDWNAGGDLPMHHVDRGRSERNRLQIL